MNTIEYHKNVMCNKFLVVSKIFTSSRQVTRVARCTKHLSSSNFFSRSASRRLKTSSACASRSRTTCCTSKVANHQTNKMHNKSLQKCQTLPNQKKNKKMANGWYSFDNASMVHPPIKSIQNHWYLISGCFLVSALWSLSSAFCTWSLFQRSSSASCISPQEEHAATSFQQTFNASVIRITCE